MVPRMNVDHLPYSKNRDGKEQAEYTTDFSADQQGGNNHDRVNVQCFAHN